MQITGIEDSAFSGCTNLTSITIPSSVTYIREFVFSNCTNLKIYVEAQSKPAGWDDNWNQSDHPVYWGVKEYKENEAFQYIIKNDNTISIVRYIGEDGFLIISSINGVAITSIEDYAFFNCTSLTNVYISENVTSIGKKSFSDCTNLTSVEIPNSITTIGDYVFANCTDITSIDIPNSITSIGNFAFSNCTGMTSINLPDSIVSIGDSAFSNCIGLTSIDIPENIINIGEFAFRGCTNITIYAETLLKPSEWSESWNYSDRPVYWAAKEFRYIILPDKTVSIEKYIGNKTNIILSKIGGVEITGIGDYAFKNCTDLTTVTLPNTLTSIGVEAFYNCTNLTNIVIPNSVISMGNSAFRDCTNLAIYAEAPAKPSDWHFSWNYSDRPVYWGVKSYHENEEFQYIIKANNTVSIVRYIGSQANLDLSYIDGIEVTSIERFAFSNCASLTSVTLLNTLTSIGIEAFYNCTGLKNINIPESVIRIEESTFSNCTSLTDITIPNSVTSIGIAAFSKCTSLTNILIPSSVISMGNSAFGNCTYLKIYAEAPSKPSGWDLYWSYAIPVYWNVKEYRENEDFQYAILNDNTVLTVKYIGTQTTLLLSKIDDIEITVIGDFTFQGYNLENITLPNSVRSIGAWAFSRCYKLANINLPNSVKSIESCAFSNCIELASITIPTSVIRMGESVFSDCNNLTIYAEASIKPYGWDDMWNSSSRPVYWGVK